MAAVQSSEVSSPGTDAKNNSSFKVKLSSCVDDSSCELVMFVVMIFKSNSILYIDQKFTIQRVVIDLVCNSRYPVNSSTNVFYFFFFFCCSTSSGLWVKLKASLCSGLVSRSIIRTHERKKANSSKDNCSQTLKKKVRSSLSKYTIELESVLI